MAKSNPALAEPVWFESDTHREFYTMLTRKCVQHSSSTSVWLVISNFQATLDKQRNPPGWYTMFIKRFKDWGIIKQPGKTTIKVRRLSLADNADSAQTVFPKTIVRQPDAEIASSDTTPPPVTAKSDPSGPRPIDARDREMWGIIRDVFAQPVDGKPAGFNLRTRVIEAAKAAGYTQGAARETFNNLLAHGAMEPMDPDAQRHRHFVIARDFQLG